MKVLPGYKLVEKRVSFDKLWLENYGSGAREMVARHTSDMLADAMIAGEVDTTMPIYVDGMQRVDNPLRMFDDDLVEVRVQLQYSPRPLQHREVEQGRRAIHG